MENSNSLQSHRDVPVNADALVDFEISEFFPYQVRIFYRTISEAVARVYIDEFDMKPYEWRTLAILGLSKALTPAQLVEQSSMDKVTVSRAIASLSKRGWVNSRSNKLDGRSRLVNTSAEGQRVFVHLIPKMRAVEGEILNCLDGEDISDLRRIMKKVVDGNG